MNDEDLSDTAATFASFRDAMRSVLARCGDGAHMALVVSSSDRGDSAACLMVYPANIGTHKAVMGDDLPTMLRDAEAWLKDIERHAVEERARQLALAITDIRLMGGEVSNHELARRGFSAHEAQMLLPRAVAAINAMVEAGTLSLGEALPTTLQ